MKGYIYKKTLLLTGKSYIGKHNGNNKHYNGSGTDWLKDIKKYVTDYNKDIKTEILEWVDDKTLLNEREEYWIKKFNADLDPLFYNISSKSAGCNSEKSRILLSKKMKNHPSIVGNKQRGNKISKALKNNNDRGNKISKSLKGKLKSELHKKNMKQPKPKGFNNNLKKPIKQIDENGNVINEFSSLTEASKKTGFNIQALNNCALGKSKSSFGYIWKYI